MNPYRGKAVAEPPKPGLIESSVLPPLTSGMKVDLAFNQEGNVWLLHDKPLTDILKWVEYDVDLDNIILVMRSGKVQDVGLKIPKEKRVFLEQALEITVMLTDNGKVADCAMVPMIIRQTYLN